jgi:glycosyltransferase involved in cell wall biosynthesis
MRPDIAVVVPTYRRPDRLRRLVDALAQQTLAADRWELVVVDDCSDDGEVDQVLRQIPELVPVATQVLRTPRNGGPALARNVGWPATHAPVVAFVDDDVVPDPTWLEAGLAAFDDPGVGVVQGLTTVPDGIDARTLAPGYSWREIEGTSPFFEGCNIFYRRAALDATSGFDERLAWWGEDTTVGWQVLESGWTGGYAPAARGVHDVERKPLRWWVRNSWLEEHFVELAARHPGFRREAFWRPWAYRKRDAALALAVLSVAAGLRWRPALLGVLPYLWIGRPAAQHRDPSTILRTGLLDAIRLAAHLGGSVRQRVLVI